jgi:hypothetical protein
MQNATARQRGPADMAEIIVRIANLPRCSSVARTPGESRLAFGLRVQYAPPLQAQQV